MAINFAAASTAGLNNPGTEIITLVKDGSGNFINPPSYDKIRAYLRSGEVPMLFVTDEAGETGSLYQLDGYSETENKIRFSNDTTTIAFSAGASAPVVSDVGGGSTAEWKLLGTYTMAVSDKSLVIDLSQFGGNTHFRIIGNFPKCSEDCGVTYLYLGTAFNQTTQPSQHQNVYAFNLLAECELVDGQLYGFIGMLDGWTMKPIASVVIDTPRDSGKCTSFKIFYEKAVNDPTENTIQIWGY